MSWSNQMYEAVRGAWGIDPYSHRGQRLGRAMAYLLGRIRREERATDERCRKILAHYDATGQLRTDV